MIYDIFLYDIFLFWGTDDLRQVRPSPSYHFAKFPLRRLKFFNFAKCELRQVSTSPTF